MLSAARRLTDAFSARIGVEPGNFVGVVLALIAGLALMGIGAVGKHLAVSLHPFETTFLRSMIMAAILVPWFARNGYARIKPTKFGFQAINGVVFAGAILGWFWALPYVPLDLVASVGFTSQLYTVMGAILFLGERAKAWRWAALGCGFVGAMIIIRPGFVAMNIGVVMLIATALLFSANRLMIKVIATTDNPETSVVWQAIWGSVFTLPAAIFVWTTPTADNVLWLLVLAALTVLSHYTMAWALRFADVGAIEPTSFIRLVWAALLGIVFFDEFPDWFTIGGGAVVVASVLYIARRERREGKARIAAGGLG
jgi:drug/metabolite transporter (DMT)-like permease